MQVAKTPPTWHPAYRGGGKRRHAGAEDGTYMAPREEGIRVGVGDAGAEDGTYMAPAPPPRWEWEEEKTRLAEDGQAVAPGWVKSVDILVLGVLVGKIFHRMGRCDSVWGCFGPDPVQSER